jgi:hypothetical protein
MGLKSSYWSCFKACFKGYTFCFTTFLVRPSTGAQQSHEQAPKTVQMNLKDQSFVCMHPWRHVTFKFWEMLKNASGVTLVPKNIFILKILNFVQSFVECEVSLADGTLTFFRPSCRTTVCVCREPARTMVQSQTTAAPCTAATPTSTWAELGSPQQLIVGALVRHAALVVGEVVVGLGTRASTRRLLRKDPFVTLITTTSRPWTSPSK